MTFIKGPNVELRVLEDADAEVFTKAVNAGLTTEHLFTGSVPMRTKDYQERWAQERKAGDILFGVWRVSKPGCPPAEEDPNVGGGRLVGTCGLHSHRDVYKSWEFRILIFDAASVGQGLGGEVTKAVVQYGFERLNANRIWLGVSAANKRAVKCYIDCDFLFEARNDDAIYYAGSYKPTYGMRILRKEWECK